MLRKEKRRYRFSKEVEEKLSKIGIHITKARGKNYHQYCHDAIDVFCYSDQFHPTIQIGHITHQNDYPNLEEYTKKLNELTNLAIEVYEIINQDYKEGETL